jgi:glycosyltransferase involved in cell wall biosynthesis
MSTQMRQATEVRRSPRAGAELSVVVINDFAGVTGGSDRVALAEAEGLARRGHQVTLIAGQGAPSAQLLAAGVTVRTSGQETIGGDRHRLGAAARGLWNGPAGALAASTLRGLDPGRTVVHLHGFTKVLSASVVRAAVRSGIPTVATLHDYFAACPNGGFFNYQTGQVCHLDPLSMRCVATHCDARSYSHKLWRVGRSGIQRTWGAMPAGVGHLIVPSSTAGQVLRPFLPAGSQLHVLPKAVPAARLPAGRPSARAPFVFIGRMDHDKGPALLARAARHASVPATFVGTGEEVERVRSLYPQAELTGWIEHDRVQDVLRRARALVNTSLWYETQGLSALEAAAHGVPAVVPDHGALRDVVADGQTGLWFRGGDVDDLAAKLARLAADDALVERLGRTAYERFWSGQWDLDTHLDRLEAVYRAALGPGAG